MQKGSLDPIDFAVLALLVGSYMYFRPYVEKGIKWLLAPSDMLEGEKEQKAYRERREAAKVGSNSIRGGKGESSVVVGGQEGKATGRTVDEKTGEVVNRKVKGGQQQQAMQVEKSDEEKLLEEEEKLLNWEDDQPVTLEGKVDVQRPKNVEQWLGKWDD